MHLVPEPPTRHEQAVLVGSHPEQRPLEVRDGRGHGEPPAVLGGEDVARGSQDVHGAIADHGSGESDGEREMRRDHGRLGPGVEDLHEGRGLVLAVEPAEDVDLVLEDRRRGSPHGLCQGPDHLPGIVADVVALHGGGVARPRGAEGGRAAVALRHASQDVEVGAEGNERVAPPPDQHGGQHAPLVPLAVVPHQPLPGVSGAGHEDVVALHTARGAAVAAQRKRGQREPLPEAEVEGVHTLSGPEHGAVRLHPAQHHQHVVQSGHLARVGKTH